MYTEQELSDIRSQKKKRWIALLIPCLLLIGVLVFSLIVRIEWLTDAATILCGILLIAGWDLFIKPLHKYAAHMDQMLHGITHQIEGTFGGISPDVSMIENVRFYGLTLICLNDKAQEYERLFYYDAEKALPTYHQGQKLIVTFHDRSIANIEAA